MQRNNYVIDHSEIVKGFHEKRKFKNLTFENIEQFFNPESEKPLRKAWGNSLSRQLPEGQLPVLDRVLDDLRSYFSEIFKKRP